jgi:hypothetical protein
MIFPIESPDVESQWKIPVTYNDGYAAGLAEGIRRCREAVEKIAESHPDINVNAENGWVKLSVILAAIDAVKGE